MINPEPESAPALPPQLEAQAHMQVAREHHRRAMWLLETDCTAMGTINRLLLQATYEQNAAILCLLMEGRKPCE